MLPPHRRSYRELESERLEGAWLSVGLDRDRLDWIADQGEEVQLELAAEIAATVDAFRRRVRS